jgi:glucokinase
MRVLAGDIGGTKTVLAVVEISASRLSLLRSRRYPSADFPTFEDLLLTFLRSIGRRPSAAAFGVAGPVRGGSARPTKLPWVLHERKLSRLSGITHVRLLNDFVAAALGVPYLSRRKVLTIRAGEQESGGPIALIGAGTGLGQAGLVRCGRRWDPVASEGGHADFGPRNPTEDRLVAFVRKRFGRVSRDRLLSGEGLGHLYDFLRSERGARESRRVARALARGDRAAVISRFGLASRDRLCRKALRLFVSIYGSEAGNLALQYRATGGVYLAGGIAPKILPALQDPLFLESFSSKPPLEELLARTPVRVVLDPRLPLFGAAAAAYRMAIDTTRPSSNTRVRPASR